MVAGNERQQGVFLFYICLFAVIRFIFFFWLPIPILNGQIGLAANPPNFIFL
jgi:hypothetical protein